MHFSDQRVVLAMQMAVMAHGDQLYGTLPYAVHLAEVAYWTKLGVTDINPDEKSKLNSLFLSRTP